MKRILSLIVVPLLAGCINYETQEKELGNTSSTTTIPSTSTSTTSTVITTLKETTSIQTTSVPITTTTTITSTITTTITSTTTTTISEYAGYRQVKLHVHTYCQKCPSVVTFALRENPGVVKVSSGDLRNKIWTVIYNPNETSVDYLRYHIAGYDTDVIEDKELK